MDEVYIVKPDISMAEEIEAYRREMLDEGSSMDGTGELRSIETAAEWLAKIALYERAETLPEGKVMATLFVCIRRSDGRLVGMIQVRHTLNDYLAAFGGHIGYSVRPSERRKGYASAMLRDVLPYCRGLGLDRVLVTCFEENTGSRRTIEKNGGIYENSVVDPTDGESMRRYWISL